MYIGITNLSDPTVRVQSPDGLSAEGIPYFDFSGLLGDQRFDPGETTAAARALAFYNPYRVPFTYDLVLVAGNNHPPAFTSVPVVSVDLGKTYQYSAAAFDPDGHAVTYELLAGPTGMTLAADGQVAWPSAGVPAGNYPVALRAADGQGGFAEQRFVLSAAVPPPNRPPVFTSVPDVVAHPGLAYRYPAAATDPDGDPLQFALQTALDNVIFSPSSGLLTWTPRADQVGAYAVTITVTDDDQAGVTQEFVIQVRTTPDNHAPVIVSAPLVQTVAGAEYRYQVVAVDADREALTYALAMDQQNIPAGLTIDGTRGLLRWPVPVDGQTIRVRVADPRGGTDFQQFTLSVNSTAIGAFQGTVFGDPDGDGQADPGETGVAGWTVYLDRNANHHWDADEQTAVTNAAGTYSFAGLLLGSYAAAVDVPADWLQTAPATASRAVTLSGAAPVTGVDFLVANRGAANRPPAFTSSPPTAAAVGRPLGYQAVAADPDLDALTYALVYGPAGMAVEPRSGAVVWTPDPTQAGTVEALLKVSDGHGGVALQPVALSVAGIDDAPVITSQPRRVARLADGVYQYPVQAHDPIDPNQPLRYWVDPASVLRGLTLHETTGVLTWGTPVAGRYDVTVWVADQDGRTAYQFYELRVTAATANQPPQVDGAMRHAILAGRPFPYQVRASDPDDDPLSYTLGAVPGGSLPGGLTLDAQGLLFWQPTLAQVNDPATPYEFTVTVGDGPGGHAVLQTYRLDVVAAAPANAPPQITSTPRLAALPGEVYAYPAAGYDPDGDTLLWQVVPEGSGAGATGSASASPGLTVDPSSGHLLWVPTAADVGAHEVVLQVTDVFGAAARQTFTITVAAANRPPLITSPARTWATAGRTYAYPVVARDPDGQPLFFELVQAPAAARIDPQSGLLAWTPVAADEGPHAVAIRVRDPLGLDAVQRYTLNVAPVPPNHPPIFRSQPSPVALAGRPYEYLAEAVDPDGDSNRLTFTVADPAAGGPAFVPENPRLLRWPAPALQPDHAPVWVTVWATDEAGQTSRQRFSIQVRQNHAPELNLLAEQTLTAGQDYAYAIPATDADGDGLSYALTAPDTGRVPAGLTLDSQLGGLSWDRAALGDYPLHITVSDGVDATSGTLRLHVLPDDQPPQVALRTSATLVDAGQAVTIWVAATDNVGVAGRSLMVNGTRVALEAGGWAVYTAQGAAGSVLHLSATATDEAGNVSAPATGQLRIRDPNDLAPTITLATPAEGAVLADVTDLVGSIIDPNQNLQSYTIEIWSVDGGEAADRHTVSAAPNAYFPNLSNAVLGQLDPTRLANGQYVVRVTATDGQNAATAERLIEVAGNLKLGNFTLTFQDLELPLAGLPITITRTYDTLQAGKEGDFGYGWRLDLTGVKVNVVQPGNTSGVPDPFRDGDRIVFTLPDGSKHGFTFVGRALNPRAPFADPQALPEYLPDVGVSSRLSLTDDAQALYRLANGYNDPAMNDQMYNPASGLYGQYELTLRNGNRLYIDPATSQLQTLVDRTGNSLTFSDSGIVHSSGRGITFERDYRNRNTAIVDPAGNRIEYTYDARGDLVAVKDRTQAVTEFYYRPSPAPRHYLDHVDDPLGRTAATTEYYDDGRVKKVIDASGKMILYTYDAGTKTQSVTDQLGGTTTQTLDARGNVIREVDPTGKIIKRTYDGQNHLLSETLVVGLVDSTANSETNDLTTSHTYNEKGDELTSTDVYGHVTFHTYGKYGEPLATTDPLGNTTANSFNPQTGNLEWTKDSSGNVTYFSQYNHGNPGVIANSDHVPLVSSTYNSHGEVTSTASTTKTDPATGQASIRTTYFVYDEDGHQTLSYHYETDAAGLQKTLIDRTSYDLEGRTTGTAQYEVSGQQTYTSAEQLNSLTARESASTSFNAAGQGLSSTDRNGLVTEHVYDLRGQEIQTRTQARRGSPDPADAEWLLTRTYYDPKGRALITTNSFVEDKQPDQAFDNSTASVASFSVYDGADRGVETWQVKNVVVAVAAITVGTATVYHSELRIGTDTFTPPAQATGRQLFDALKNFFQTHDALVSHATTQYDSAGRVVSSFDQYGNETRTLYNVTGEVIQTATQSKDEEGDSVWLVSRTVYDAYGRVELSTDRFAGQASSPNTISGMATTATRTLYDEQGRAWKTQRLTGVVVNINGLGQDRTSEIQDVGSVLSSTQTVYDARGRVQRSVAADGQTTDYVYDALGRQIATLGQAVPASSVALPPAVASQISSLASRYVRLRSETDYDAQGRTAIQRTNLVVVQDTAGVVLATLDDAQQETAYQYDEFGNRVRTSYDDGSFVLVRYDQQGRQVAESQQTAGLYLVGWSGSANSFVVTGWDADGNGQADSTQPAGALAVGTPIPTKLYEYDVQGRLSAVELPAVPDPQHNGTLTRPRYEYGYDAQGNQTLIRDPLGRETRYTFDTQGHQLTRTLPLGYGPDGRLGTSDDATLPEGGFQEWFTYDDQGRQQLHVSFEGVVAQSVYDSDGRLTQQNFFPTEAAYNNGSGSPNQIWTHEYDAFGRQRQIVQDDDGNLATTADQRITTDAYDPAGRLITVTSPEGTIHYEYDALGRHTRTYTGSADTTGIAAAANGVAVTDTAYAYDVLGRLEAVTVRERFDTPLATPESTDYVYDLLGNLDEVHLPNNVISQYQYDDLNRLERLRTFRDENHDGAYTAAVDALLAEYDYDLQPDGRRAGVTETDDQGRTTRIDWSYDDVGRLTREAFNSYDNSLDFVTDYRFDLVGNRLGKLTDTAPTFAGTPTFDATVAYTYDANDRLHSESLDTSGDAVAEQTTIYGYDHTQETNKTVWQGQDTNPATGTRLSQTAYTYNLQGRMSGAVIDADGDGSNAPVTELYAYDADGIRILKIDGGQKVLYLVDGNNPTGYAQVLQEMDAAQQLLRSYTLGLDVISQAQSASTIYHLLYDGHGSTRALTNGSGVVIGGQTFAYDAYGNAIGFNPALALTVFLYSGEQFDQRLQMQYLRARYYDLATGRFNRLDPFFGDLNDPLSLQKYLYVHGDPIQGVDPTGLMSLGESLSVMQNMTTRFANKLDAALRVYNRVSSIVDAIELASQLARIFSPSGQGILLAGFNTLLNAATDPSFAAVLTKSFFENAVKTYTNNIPRIMRTLAARAPMPQFANAMRSLLSQSAQLLVFMPTPPAPFPNPHVMLRTGLKIKLRGIQIKVTLYFGHGRFRGRYLGLGVTDNTTAENRRPHQFFRMDWHGAHGAEDWSDGNFHFHVLPKR